jgi:cyclopropane-fatty-acyl-phospholipid synthase
MMPADALFLHYQDHLAIEQHWRVSGRHYGQTAEHWLANVDRNRAQALAALAADGLDTAAAKLQVNRWRIFFMACAELWNFRGGNEWFVAHYLFRPRAA